MKISFVGSNGMIGSAVYDILKHNHDIVTLGRGNSHNITLDLLKPDDITSAMFKGSQVLILMWLHYSGQKSYKSLK